MSNMRPVEEPSQQRGGGLGGGITVGNTHIPYWAIAVGAVTLGVIGFLVWRQTRGTTSTSTQAQLANGTVQTASLTPMGASGSPTGQYDVVPVPYPTANTTTGTTAAQSAGLGLTASDGTQVAGQVQTPTSGPIMTPSTGGYPVTNQIYWVSGSGSDLGTSVSNSNPTAQSLAPTGGAGQVATSGG